MNVNKFNIKKPLLISFMILIASICLYYMAIGFKWDQIWLATQKVNYIFFFLTVSMTLIFYFFVRTLRWQLLLKDENIKISFSKLYLYNTLSIGISTITPFQSGEALKVELIRKHGGKRLSGYSIFFLERVLDLVTVLTLAIISTYLGLDFGVSQVYIYLISLIFIAALLIIITGLFVLPFEKFQPIKIWIKGNWQKKWNLLAAFMLTIISWMATISGWKLALASFSINIDFLQVISLVTLTTILSILSFVPGGIGISEISISTLLTKMGLEISSAQTGAIAIRAYALVIIILTLFHWLYFKFTDKRNSSGVV